MNDAAARYRTVASGFTRCAVAVPDAAWDDPAPCDGWVARDIVRHLVEWVPAFLHDGAGVELPHGPSVDTAPASAWITMSDGVQALLDDPVRAAGPFDHPHVGRHRLDDAVMTFILHDVLVHTWDLARATGLDESLDPDEVAQMFDGIQSMDEVLRSSGQFGPRIDVDEDADIQTKLIAFVGRQP
jgi:uncharacterized protein (TIGR03086 family)